jgi:hypothetical protein
MRSRVTFLYGVIGACVLTPFLAACSADADVTGASSETTVVESTTSVVPVSYALGDSAIVDDVAVTVQSARVTDTINEGLAHGRFLVLDVTLANTGDHEAPYSPPSWSLRTAEGRSLGVYPMSDDGRLEFGTLAPGATVQGMVGFDLATTSGAAEVQYHPPRSDAAAAWSLTL